MFSYLPLKQRLIEEQSLQPPNTSLIIDLQAAIMVIEEDHLGTILDVEKLTKESTITFNFLWAIYRPNALVYSHHALANEPRILIVRRTFMWKDPEDDSLYRQIVCDVLRDDGDSWGWAQEAFDVKKFTGAKPITGLPVFPLEYHHDKETIYKNAVETGKMLTSLPSHACHEFTGPVVRQVENELDPSEPKLDKFWVRGV